MPRIEKIRQTARQRLRQAGVSQPEASADLLLMRSLSRDLAFLIAHPEAEMPEHAQRRFDNWIEQRVAGVPTQYLLGVQEFYGREFAVTPAVLIPRPETELVVDMALELAQRQPSPVIVDVGAGSGCIAITLALELRARKHPARIFGVDISAPALELARANARRMAAEVEWLQGDLLAPWLTPGAASSLSPQPLPQLVDLIVSNPPYIAEMEMENLQPEVRNYEPRLALAAGTSGLEIYLRLLPQSAALLAPGAWLVLELGDGTQPRLMPHLAGWQEVQIRNDLQGIARVLAARRPPHAAPSAQNLA